MSMYIYHRTDIPRIRPLSIPLVIPCPQIGNIAFRDYIHTDPFFLTQQLHIYRYVLGWKHDTSTTITLPTNNSSSSSNTTTASYYHHIGNVTVLFASVPFGWSAAPFIWIPGAITCHYGALYHRLHSMFLGSAFARLLVDSLVGSLDGALVGSLLGNLVGILVCNLVGRVVGTSIGAFVGGFLVGVLMGSPVGRLVTSVGEFVGSWSAPSSVGGIVYHKKVGFHCFNHRSVCFIISSIYINHWGICNNGRI